jgi:hypothetical protein
MMRDRVMRHDMMHDLNKAWNVLEYIPVNSINFVLFGSTAPSLDP